jgi:DNA-binding transcriptional MerR regulator/thiamine kinase-like enzyme
MDTYWAIGDLARAAGVTVRTLRYYEQVGLLTTPERTGGLHRRYTDADVERLYEIVALRSLGLSLDAISTALGSATPALADVMRQQLAHVDERIERDERLRKRLLAITAAIPDAGDPSPRSLLDVMEMMTMTDNTSTRVERLLKSTGHLTTGHITDLTEEPIGGNSSRVTRLVLQYSADATPPAPATLVLKENLPVAWAQAGGAQEVQFYRTIGGLPDHPDVVPTSYGVEHDMVTGDSQILLADLTTSHHPATADRDRQIGGDVPDEATIDQVVDALARLHAFWWDNPLLRDGLFPLLDFNGDTTRWSAYEQHRTKSWESADADESNPVPSEAHRVVEQVYAGFGSHWYAYMKDRVGTRQNLTLMHGDTYFVNFLVPNDSAADGAVLLDWQCPTGNIGAFDLVNLCATFWTREQRKDCDREARILHRYHDGLVASGITDYTWDQLCEDYRAGIIYWLLVPIQDAHDGAAASYWQPKITCLAEAFDDWHCATLL